MTNKLKLDQFLFSCTLTSYSFNNIILAIRAGLKADFVYLFFTVSCLGWKYRGKLILWQISLLCCIAKGHCHLLNPGQPILHWVLLKANSVVHIFRSLQRWKFIMKSEKHCSKAKYTKYISFDMSLDITTYGICSLKQLNGIRFAYEVHWMISLQDYVIYRVQQ